MDDAARPSRRGSFLPSLVTSGGILVWLTLTGVLGLLIAAVGSEWTLPLRIGELGQGMARGVALSVAGLISFWLVAPIVARLRPWAVTGRSLVAGLIALVLTWPVEFAILTGYFNQATIDQAGGLYDLEDLDPILSSGDIAWLALGHDAQSILFHVPLYVLAGLAVWLWLRRKETAHGEA